MIYVKSFLVGMLASAIVVPLLCILLLLFMRLRFHAAAISLNASLLRSSGLWLLLIAVFALGFVWEYRRLAR